MLKHEDNSQAPAQSAARVRVTPEELAAAVTALQIRKEGAPGTIAIGDAVDGLGLDVTPEEVLAEVHARRATTRRLLPKKRLKVLSAALAAMVGLSIWGITQQPTGSPSVAVQAVPTTSFIPLQGPTPQRTKVDPNLVVSDASGKLMMLSEIGDNKPVTCVLNGGSFQRVDSGGQSRWTLIKYQGKVYVRGWMAKASPKVLQEDGADVRASQNSISVPVTLPIGGFRFSETPQNVPGEEFHASDIHLDKHAYEKW